MIFNIDENQGGGSLLMSIRIFGVDENHVGGSLCFQIQVIKNDENQGGVNLLTTLPSVGWMASCRPW